MNARGARTVRNRRPPPASKPGRVGQLVARANSWRDHYNPIRGLDMARAVALLEAGERGEWADLQWIWRAIEKRNAVCRSLIVRRMAALVKLDWNVKVSSMLPAGATDAIAKSQQATLRRWYDRIDNLRDAIRHLALAEFRGFAHLQVQVDSGTGGRAREAGFEAAAASRAPIFLEPLDQWHWVREGSGKRWGWNPEAQPVSWSAIPADRIAEPKAWGLVIREVRMPIDEIALLVHIRRAMSQKDWDAYVEIYGIPSGVVVMPNGIPEGKAEDYEAAAKAIAEGGSGALPFGSDYKPNDSPRGVNPFKEHLQYQDAELVLAGTGGKLTMLAESGSGTLAGGAHQATFNDLATAEAALISEVFQRQFDARVLALEHPRQPVCAYWELAAVATADTDKLVDRIVKLGGIGLRPTAEEVSERTGLRLEREKAPRGSRAVEASGPAVRCPDPRRSPSAELTGSSAFLTTIPGATGTEDSRPGANSASRGSGARRAVRGGKDEPAPAMGNRERVAGRPLSAAGVTGFLGRLEAIERISDPDIRRARLEALLADWNDRGPGILDDPAAAAAFARVREAVSAAGIAPERTGLAEGPAR